MYNCSLTSNAWPPVYSVASMTIPCWDGFRLLFANTEQQANLFPFILFLRLLSPRPSNVTPPPRRTLRKRGCPDAEEVRRLKDFNPNLEMRLTSAMRHIETISAVDSGRLKEEKTSLLGR